MYIQVPSLMGISCAIEHYYAENDSSLPNSIPGISIGTAVNLLLLIITMISMTTLIEHSFALPTQYSLLLMNML